MPPDPVPVSGRGGQAFYILDVCPENRDESNGDSIIKLSLQFIPIFGVLHSQLRKGHTKKRHFHVLSIFSFSEGNTYEIPSGIDTYGIKGQSLNK
jgi:hypothetical protein